MRAGLNWSGALVLLIALAACGETDPNSVRPGSEHLERLATPQARARIARAAPELSKADLSQAQQMCGEVIRISEQGGLIVDRSNPSRLVVSASLWTRLPPEGRQGVVQCVRALRPAAVRNAPMGVVVQG